MKAIFIEKTIPLNLGAKEGHIFGCRALPYYLVDGTVVLDLSQCEMEELPRDEITALETLFRVPLIALFKRAPFEQCRNFERVDCVSAEFLEETPEVLDFEQKASALSREIYYLDSTDTLDGATIIRISTE